MNSRCAMFCSNVYLQVFSSSTPVTGVVRANYATIHAKIILIQIYSTMCSARRRSMNPNNGRKGMDSKPGTPTV